MSNPYQSDNPQGHQVPYNEHQNEPTIQQYQGYSTATPSPVPQGKGMAIASMVLGIVAVLFSFIPVVNLLSFLLGIAAVVFGIIALKKNSASKGMSITGIITGAVSLFIAMLVLILFGMAMSAASTDLQKLASERTVQMNASISDGAQGIVTYDIDGSLNEEAFTGEWERMATNSGFNFEGVHVYAQDNADADVSCTLSINGTEVSTLTGKGSVSCYNDSLDQ